MKLLQTFILFRIPYYRDGVFLIEIDNEYEVMYSECGFGTVASRQDIEIWE